MCFAFWHDFMLLKGYLSYYFLSAQTSQAILLWSVIDTVSACRLFTYRIFVGCWLSQNISSFWNAQISLSLTNIHASVIEITFFLYSYVWSEYLLRSSTCIAWFYTFLFSVCSSSWNWTSAASLINLRALAKVLLLSWQKASDCKLRCTQENTY